MNMHGCSLTALRGALTPQKNYKCTCCMLSSTLHLAWPPCTHTHAHTQNVVRQPPPSSLPLPCPPLPLLLSPPPRLEALRAEQHTLRARAEALQSEAARVKLEEEEAVERQERLQQE
jgi:hypothetical protein